MSLPILASDIVVNGTLHWYEIVSGVLVLLFLLWIIVEMILMIPDFIRTVKIHMM